MIDPAFSNINVLFVLSFKLGRNVSTRNYFNRHCLPLVEIKGFNVLIDNEPFFDQRITNKQETYENLSKCQETIIIQQETN